MHMWPKYQLIFITMAISLVTTNIYAYNMLQGYDRLPREIRAKPSVADLISEDNNKVQVLYFFSYGCHACANFDPNFRTWALQQNNPKVRIHKIPVFFRKDWEGLARLYYVMKILDPKEELGAKIFTEIQDKNVALWQTSEMQNFFVKNGYKITDFENAINSFTVNTELKKADQLSKAYEIYQTPTIILNGIIDSYELELTNDYKTFFATLDGLIAGQFKMRIKS